MLYRENKLAVQTRLSSVLGTYNDTEFEIGYNYTALTTPARKFIKSEDDFMDFCVNDPRNLTQAMTKYAGSYPDRYASKRLHESRILGETFAAVEIGFRAGDNLITGIQFEECDRAFKEAIHLTMGNIEEVIRVVKPVLAVFDIQSEELPAAPPTFLCAVVFSVKLFNIKAVKKLSTSMYEALTNLMVNHPQVYNYLRVEREVSSDFVRVVSVILLSKES